jgi:hypothetical protein
MGPLEEIFSATNIIASFTLDMAREREREPSGLDLEMAF